MSAIDRSGTTSRYPANQNPKPTYPKPEAPPAAPPVERGRCKCAGEMMSLDEWIKKYSEMDAEGIEAAISSRIAEIEKALDLDSQSRGLSEIGGTTTRPPIGQHEAVSYWVDLRHVSTRKG